MLQRVSTTGAEWRLNPLQMMSGSCMNKSCLTGSQLVLHVALFGCAAPLIQHCACALLTGPLVVVVVLLATKFGRQLDLGLTGILLLTGVVGLALCLAWRSTAGRR